MMSEKNVIKSFKIIIVLGIRVETKYDPIFSLLPYVYLFYDEHDFYMLNIS